MIPVGEDVVFVYFTLLTIIVVISNIINRLGEEKRTRTEKIINDDHGNHDNTNNEKTLLQELYSAADKCFIKEYAEKCKKLSAVRPSLINVKFPPTGQTPFHRVCFHGEALLIKDLLGKGADPHLNSNAGEGPMCFAIHYYMQRNDLGINEPLECLEVLRNAGCILNASDIWYNVFLERSVRTKKKTLTEWLLTNSGHRNPSYKLTTRPERLFSEPRIFPI